jgi:hypothetical protein
MGRATEAVTDEDGQIPGVVEVRVCEDDRVDLQRAHG